MLSDVCYFTRLDTSDLYVEQQEITGFEGESVQVRCHHKNRKNKEKPGWCRLGSCPGRQDSSWGQIDQINGSLFEVTMKDLRMDSSGWYMCVYDDLDMPVHLTVLQKTTTPPTTSKYQSVF